MRKLGVFLILVLAAVFPATVQARGSLDPTFGAGGRVARETPSRTIFGPTQVRTGPSGKIYALYRGSLLAFEPDGSADLSFGTGGVVPLLERIPFGYGARLAVDSYGRLIVAGSLKVEESPYSTPVVASQLLAVTRLLPDGSPDPSFNGGEELVTDLGLPEAVPPPGVPAYVRGGFFLSVAGIAVDDSDRIVIAGDRASAYYANKFGFIPMSEGIAARLDSGGAIDRTYGADGVARGFAPQGVSGSAAAPNGSLYISYRLPGGVGASRIVHLTPNGFPARRFGGTSGVRVKTFGEVEMATDGKGRLTIVDASRAAPGIEATVTRFRLDGRPAAAFGRGGRLNVGFPRANALSSVAIAEDRSGGAFLATTVTAPGGAVERFGLAHVTRHGNVDRRFGRFATGFGANTRASAASLSVDERGRPLVAGGLNSPLLPGRLGLAMARYLPN